MQPETEIQCSFFIRFFLKKRVRRYSISLRKTVYFAITVKCKKGVNLENLKIYRCCRYVLFCRKRFRAGENN